MPSMICDRAAYRGFRITDGRDEVDPGPPPSAATDLWSLVARKIVALKCGRRWVSAKNQRATMCRWDLMYSQAGVHNGLAR